jgi:hypothetical protein
VTGAKHQTRGAKQGEAASNEKRLLSEMRQVTGDLDSPRPSSPDPLFALDTRHSTLCT